MLIDLKVALITVDSSFILLHGLVEVTLFFVEKTNLDECVCLSLKGEGVGEDGVLEVADGLLDLVGLGEDHTELVEDFTLLVEIR